MRALGRALAYGGLGTMIGVALVMTLRGSTIGLWIALFVSGTVWACGAVLMALDTERIRDEELHRYLLDEDWEPTCKNHGNRHCLVRQKGCPVTRERVT